MAQRVSAFVLVGLLCAVFMPTDVYAESTEYDALVDRYFGLFVVPVERRSSVERVRFRDGVLEMDYHWSAKTKKDLMCTGGRWLIVGRLNGAKGARDLFKRRPEVERIRLRFVTRETKVEPIGDGRYRQKEKAVELAWFELSAQRAMDLNPTVLRKTLSGKRCERFVKSLLDEARVVEDSSSVP